MTQLDDLIEFLAASPSPWHVVSTAADRLIAAGFEPIELGDTVERRCRARVRGARRGAGRVEPRAIGRSRTRRCDWSAPTPTRRACAIKPRPDTGGVGWKQLGVEVYGGALINSWLDRDLGIAGRVELADGSSVDVCVDEAVCRVPQLAIHLDRDVNERGLILDKQQHLTPVWGSGSPRAGEFSEWLAGRLGVGAARRSPAWELCLFDRTPPAILGGDESLLAAGRLDNQLSCWAAVDAISKPRTTGDADLGHRPVRPRGGRVGEHDRCRGPLLEHVLERLALASGCVAEREFLRSWRRARASRPTTPTRCIPTIANATIPIISRSSTGVRRSSSTATSATRPRRDRPRCCGGCSTRPACRRRCSSAATTCRAARRSARSPQPGSASRPSMSACRSSPCTRLASCAASRTRSRWPWAAPLLHRALSRSDDARLGDVEQPLQLSMQVDGQLARRVSLILRGSSASVDA